MNMSPTYYVCGSKIECERARAKENEWCTIERKQKWPIPDSFQKISTDYICVFFSLSSDVVVAVRLVDCCWCPCLGQTSFGSFKSLCHARFIFRIIKNEIFLLGIIYSFARARALSLSLLYWTISVADANATKSVSFAADGKKRERKWRRVGMKWNVWRRFQRAISFEI